MRNKPAVAEPPYGATAPLDSINRLPAYSRLLPVLRLRRPAVLSLSTKAIGGRDRRLGIDVISRIRSSFRLLRFRLRRSFAFRRFSRFFDADPVDVPIVALELDREPFVGEVIGAGLQ